MSKIFGHLLLLVPRWSSKFYFPLTSMEKYDRLFSQLSFLHCFWDCPRLHCTWCLMHRALLTKPPLHVHSICRVVWHIPFKAALKAFLLSIHLMKSALKALFLLAYTSQHSEGSWPGENKQRQRGKKKKNTFYRLHRTGPSTFNVCQEPFPSSRAAACFCALFIFILKCQLLESNCKNTYCTEVTEIEKLGEVLKTEASLYVNVWWLNCFLVYSPFKWRDFSLLWYEQHVNTDTHPHTYIHMRICTLKWGPHMYPPFSAFALCLFFFFTIMGLSSFLYHLWWVLSNCFHFPLNSVSHHHAFSFRPHSCIDEQLYQSYFYVQCKSCRLLELYELAKVSF